jgi:hypothetical protein
MNNNITIIAGPCVIESAELLDIVARKLVEINTKLGTDIIFKASFDKANRTSIHSFRGPGLERGLQMLGDIKEKYGTQMFSIGAICLGLFVLGYPIIELIHAKTKYKEIVEATVVRVDSRRSHGKHHTRTYRPVYEFTYSGRTYTVKEEVFTSGRHPMVGEIRDLAIDENDPEVFYDFRSMSQKLVGTSIFGVAAIAVGVIIMVMA